MKRELLTIEFRYFDSPLHDGGSGYKTKRITIGIFDTLEEAVQKGNCVIQELSKQFEVRQDDKFAVHGLFGLPMRLVSNCCYPTNGVSYFAKITTLDFADIPTTISEAFEATARHRRYLKEQEDED